MSNESINKTAHTINLPQFIKEVNKRCKAILNNHIIPICGRDIHYVRNIRNIIKEYQNDIDIITILIDNVKIDNYNKEDEEFKNLINLSSLFIVQSITFMSNIIEADYDKLFDEDIREIQYILVDIINRFFEIEETCKSFKSFDECKDNTKLQLSNIVEWINTNIKSYNTLYRKMQKIFMTYPGFIDVFLRRVIRHIDDVEHCIYDRDYDLERQIKSYSILNNILSKLNDNFSIWIDDAECPSICNMDDVMKSDIFTKIERLFMRDIINSM